MRDLARRVEQAFFGNLVTNGPSGLLSLGNNVQKVAVAGTLADLDWPAEAISLAENVGATVTAFCASSATVLALSKLRAFSGASTSNEPLLSADPTQATRRSVLGVPLYPLPSGVIANGVVWAISKAKSFVVLRANESDAVARGAKVFTLGKHISPYLGRVQLARLDPSMVREWRANLLAAGVSESMAAKAYRLLRAVLMTADASMSSPAARTPTARSPSTVIDSTGVSSRMEPSSSDASLSHSVTTPPSG